MKILNDDYGQASAELILIISTMTIIVVITAHYTTSILNDITKETEKVIENGREYILSKL